MWWIYTGRRIRRRLPKIEQEQQQEAEEDGKIAKKKNRNKKVIEGLTGRRATEKGREEGREKGRKKGKKKIRQKASLENPVSKTVLRRHQDPSRSRPRKPRQTLLRDKCKYSAIIPSLRPHTRHYTSLQVSCHQSGSVSKETSQFIYRNPIEVSTNALLALCLDESLFYSAARSEGRLEISVCSLARIHAPKRTEGKKAIWGMVYPPRAHHHPPMQASST